VPIDRRPDAIFIPPPTVPSTSRPELLPPGAPGVRPAAIFDLGFSLTATEEYSDNFNLAGDEDADGGGRQDNFRSIVTPGATLGINGAFTKGVIAVGLSAVHDSSDDDGEIKIFPSLTGQVSWEATPRLNLALSDTFVRSDEATRADRLSLRRERRTFTANTFSARANYLLDRVATSMFYSLGTFSAGSRQRNTAHSAGVTAGTTFYETNSASVGYTYLTTSSENETADTTNLASGSSDVSGHQFTGSFQRQLSALTSAGVTGSYALRHTEDGSANGGSGDGSEDFSVWTAALFSSYRGPKLSLNGSLGYSQVIGESGERSSSIFTASSLTYQFARATASIGVDSGFSETYAEGENFGLVQTRGITGSLSYPFTSAIFGTVSAYYRQNESAGGGSSQNTWGGAASLSIQLARWLGLLIDYSHTETSSPDRRVGSGAGRGGEQIENRARISLSAFF
jgi:hypothetical protein